jgi:hypothetical protein
MADMQLRERCVMQVTKVINVATDEQRATRLFQESPDIIASLQTEVWNEK